MLQQLIDEEIERIKNEFDDKLAFIADPEKLRAKRDTIMADLETAKQTASTQVQGGFLTRLGKKYKTAVQEKEAAEQSIPKLQQAITELDTRIDSVESELARHIKSKQLAIESVRSNPTKVIDSAIKRNPSLCQNEEFMTECVAFNMRYATLDKSGSDKVFMEFLNKYQKEYLHPANLGANYPVAYIEELRAEVEEIKSEITNPESVPEGTYKIPHKYLFDAIKKRFAEMDPERATTFNARTIYDAFVEYKEACGQMTEEHGKQLEVLYDSPDTYLYMHSIDYRGQDVTKDGQTLDGISQAICEEGLRLTTMGNEVGKINYTTLNTKDDRWFGFANFVPYWTKKSGVVVLQIPKSKIDNHEPVIGSNESESLSPSNPGYVLPEYVVGRIIDGKYQENPVPVHARATYKHIVPEVPRNANAPQGYSM